MATVLRTVLLLIVSNIFMTFAWYGHLKFKNSPLLWVILISWGIAFFEYCFQIPANRWGSDVLSAPQLKMLQEVLTFIVFAVFSVFYLKQKPTLYDAGAFVLILGAIGLSIFQPRS